MAEPQPGAPGGSSGGPTNATAATFVVNDSSLRKLRTTWQGLAKDVRDFSKAIGELKRHERDLDSLRSKLQGLGGIGGNTNTGAATGGRVPNMPPAPAPPSGGGTPPLGGGTPSGGQPRPAASNGFNWRLAGMTAAGTGVGAVGGYFARNMGGISDLNLLTNQLARSEGTIGGYSTEERQAQMRALINMSGAQSLEDTVSAGGILSTVGATATSARGGAALREASGFAALRPEAGITGQDRAFQQVYNPETSNALRMMTGTGVFAPGGQRRTQQQVFDSLLQSTFRRGNYSAESLRQGLQPGMGLYNNLQAAGLGPDAVQQFQRYAEARINLGGDASGRVSTRDASLGRRIQQAGLDAQGGQDTADVKRLGLRNSIRSRQNLLSEAQADAAATVGEAATPALQGTFETLAEVTGSLTESFRALDNSLGGLGGDDNGSIFGGAVGLTGMLGAPIAGLLGGLGVGGGAMLAQTFGPGLLRRVRPGAGGGTGGPGGGPGGALGGLIDGDSGGVQKVFVTNFPDCCFGKGKRRKGKGAGGADLDVDTDGRNRQPDPPDPARPQPAGRGSRFSRLTSRLPTSALGRAGLAGATIGGMALGQELLEDTWGERNEEGVRATNDRIASAAATVGKYTASGAMIGSLIPIPGIGTGVGAGVGAAVGTARATWEWFRGQNRRRIPPPGQPQPQPQTPVDPEHPMSAYPPYEPSAGVPMFSKGGVIPGRHRRDDVVIKATPGEVVVPLKVVGKYGGPKKLMELLGFHGQGENGHYAKGGEVKDDWGGPPARVGMSAQERGNQTTVVGGGKSVTVHQKIAGSVRGFLDELVASGYDMKSVAGYNARYIAGTRKWSNHAWGTAIDIDPFGLGNGFDRGTKSKIGTGFKGNAWIVALARKYGLGWGGEWKNKKDWMHFEAIGAPSSTKYGGAAGPLLAADATTSATDEHASTAGATSPAAQSRMYVDPRSYGSELEALAGIGSGGGVVRALGAAVPSQSQSAAEGTPEASTTTGTAPAAPVSTTGNVALGQQKAEARGWTGGEWDALHALWKGESEWNHRAANPTTSARGIAQTMMSVHFGKNWQSSADAKAFLNDPGRQIDWGLDYIAGRYKTPSNAYAKWKSRSPHWYEKGAWEVFQDELAQLHAGEMVVPKRTAQKLRSMIQAGRTAQVSSEVSPLTGTTPVQRSVSLHITAPVTVVGRGTQQDARQFLELVQREAENSATLDALGAG